MNNDLVFSGTKDEQAANWYYRTYHAATPLRFHTFQMALNILNQRHENPTIVETGCQRMLDDPGAGMSTSIFAEYVSRYGGHLISVDIDVGNLGTAKQVAARFPGADTRFVLDDSVRFLSTYGGPCDLLYLDSWDYPIGDMWAKFGWPKAGDAAIAAVEKLTRAQVMAEFGRQVMDCQRHCLQEFRVMESCLPRTSLVLADDNNLPGGGKTYLLKHHLKTSGWICLYDDVHTLWTREL